MPGSITDFTLAGYRILLDSLRDRGYEARRYPDSDPAKKHLVLTHDLDMSIQSALAVAEVEHDLGVVATYFVMLRTEMYNPFSQRGLAALNRLVELGHELGLHFDASIYNDDPDILDEAAERECAALEALTGRPVQFLSFHRPAVRLQGMDRLIAGRHHTYEPRFFSNGAYCSDSRGGWHHGHPLDHPAVAEGRELQLLTHPIWWNAASDDSVREKLDRFALRRFDLIRAELARNCEAYPQAFQALDPERPSN